MSLLGKVLILKKHDMQVHEKKNNDVTVLAKNEFDNNSIQMSTCEIHCCMRPQP